MTSWAVPGARCVCIDDDFGFVQTGEHVIPTRIPMLNEVLTVRAVKIGEDSILCSNPGGVFLFFWEIDRKQACGPLTGEVSWFVECFRPLTERPTSIEIFERLLTPAKVGEGA